MKYVNTIIGQYTIKANNHVLLRKDNLITNEGEKFILQRLVNNRSDYINDIAIGSGGGIPNKEDTTLNELLLATNVNSVIDTNSKELKLTGTFDTTTSSKINEIGVRTNESKLLTHDTFEDLTLPENSSIAITYTFKLGVSTIATDWTITDNYNNTYYTYDSQTVLGVEETDTQNGYTLKNSVSEVNENNNSYYYDDGVLYIHTSDNQAPNKHTIQIKY